MRHMLEMYVESDYIIVYFHHGLTSNNRPSFKWLQTAYREVDRKLVALWLHFIHLLTVLYVDTL